MSDDHSGGLISGGHKAESRSADPSPDASSADRNAEPGSADHSHEPRSGHFSGSIRNQVVGCILKRTGRVGLLLLACDLIAACGSGESPGSAGNSSGATEDTVAIMGEAAAPAGGANGASVPGVEPDSAWTVAVSNVGGGLALQIRGAEALRIACTRDPREMTIDVPGFTSIGSEERLSLGIDDEPYVFVAQVTPPPPVGVHATRSIDDEVLEALRSATTVSAFYGAQTTGPHSAPDSAEIQTFLSACRQAAAQ